jgi:hypothetical protein
VVACIGHWYVSLLYVAPVALIVAVLRIQTMRDRRAERRGRHDSATQPR